MAKNHNDMKHVNLTSRNNHEWTVLSHTNERSERKIYRYFNWCVQVASFHFSHSLSTLCVLFDFD